MSLLRRRLSLDESTLLGLIAYTGSDSMYILYLSGTTRALGGGFTSISEILAPIIPQYWLRQPAKNSSDGSSASSAIAATC